MPPSVIEGTGNQLKVLFQTDSKSSGKGFNATYQTKGKTSFPDRCWHGSEDGGTRLVGLWWFALDRAQVSDTTNFTCQ